MNREKPRPKTPQQQGCTNIDTEPLQPPPYAQVNNSTAYQGTGLYSNQYDNPVPVSGNPNHGKHTSALSKAYRTYVPSTIVGGCIDILIVILAAIVLSKMTDTDMLLMASTAYTVGVAGLSVPLMFLRLRPRSATDARPPAWLTCCIVVSKLLLLASGILLLYNFAVRGDHGGYRRDESAIRKRIYIGHINATLAYRLTLVAGCCAIGSVFAGVRQVWIINSIGSSSWNPDDVRALYESPRWRKNKEMMRAMISHR